MLIQNTKTETASVSLVRIGAIYVVSAFLTNEAGRPDYDLGELGESRHDSELEAREQFAHIVRAVQTSEAMGTMQNMLAMRKLADYARLDAMGAVP